MSEFDWSGVVQRYNMIKHQADYIVHEHIWGVPCGPVLEMVDAIVVYEESVATLINSAPKHLHTYQELVEARVIVDYKKRGQ